MTATTGSAEVLALADRLHAIITTPAFTGLPPMHISAIADARNAFLRLAAKPAEDVREATIEECAKIAASFKYSDETKKATNGARAYGNDDACDKIALAIA